MIPPNNNQYLDRLPAILDWIDRTIAASHKHRRSVASFGFPKLSRYFSAELLKGTSVVATEHLPVPPLSALGLPDFNNFEEQDFGAITLKKTYFVKIDLLRSERLHFHELVHIIQWQVLGPEKFLVLYADGLAKYGYFASPLEEIARLHESQFEGGQAGYDVATAVAEQTLRLANSID